MPLSEGEGEATGRGANQLWRATWHSRQGLPPVVLSLAGALERASAKGKGAQQQHRTKLRSASIGNGAIKGGAGPEKSGDSRDDRGLLCTQSAADAESAAKLARWHEQRRSVMGRPQYGEVAAVTSATAPSGRGAGAWSTTSTAKSRKAQPMTALLRERKRGPRRAKAEARLRSGCTTECARRAARGPERWRKKLSSTCTARLAYQLVKQA